MYEIENDTIYCYPGTDILKNKLNIRDALELAAFEAEISSQRAQEPVPEGDLDYAHYRALHKHLSPSSKALLETKTISAE